MIFQRLVWMDGWMDGWMDEWMVGFGICLSRLVSLTLNELIAGEWRSKRYSCTDVVNCLLYRTTANSNGDPCHRDA
jgi:hypothetical protein